MRSRSRRTLSLVGLLLGGMLLSGRGLAAGEMPTVAAQATPSKPRPAHAAARVIIISEDGLRPDLVVDMHLHWHEFLYRRGAYSWRARTIRTASTLPSHASMLSGFDVDAHGLSWNSWKPQRGYIKVPTIFEMAEKAGLKTAMFVGKSKLRHIAAPGTVDVFERPGYYCKRVAEEAAGYLVRERPPVTFIHFSDPDEAGHDDGWGSSSYRRAVSQSDQCLGIIVQALEKADLLDETLIIVSADHGGHHRTHSGAQLIDRLIPWIACGPGIRQGYRIRGEVSTLDTAATVLYALGLPLPPDLRGRPVLEAFRTD